ncbi:MAG: peptidoglycan-binding domain-containing protein, partial [Longimicrobiales bacterium]|nr:peptidoglycan-binding domain-containing protein [Longimicrobiales bacterium]
LRGAGGPTPLDGLSAGLGVRACGGAGRGDETARPSAIGETWLSPDPLTFMTGIACFTQFTAGVLRASDLTEDQKKAEIARAREQVAERIRLAGEETVDGRPTYVLTMTDLGLTQTIGAVPGVERSREGRAGDGENVPASGPHAPDEWRPTSAPAQATRAGSRPVMEDDVRVEFQTATVWIDAEYFVRRKTRFEGVMHAEGQSREFFMERLERDYRTVPGTALYEPYLTVMRVGGMTTPEQEREMQEAVAQLEEFERQMASMPASQRAMMERMMGDKIEQARALAQGGAVEFQMITTSIVVNPDLSAGAPSFLGEAALIRVIQQDLTTLGYDPGPANGELTEQTRAAIVKFQTDTGLEPTGEATPALASALKTALAGR